MKLVDIISTTNTKCMLTSTHEVNLATTFSYCAFGREERVNKKGMLCTLLKIMDDPLCVIF